MKLSQLINQLSHYECLNKKTDVNVTGIHYDSRKIKPGHIFVAMRGHQTDGHHYIPQAIKNGACAIVAETENQDHSNVIYIHVPDSRYALADLAQTFYGNPSHKICLLGITGTNGKTTTAYLIENIFKAKGYQTGVISTIEYRYHNRVFPNPLTTPESLDLQRIFFEMQSNGITHVIMEVSSHALALNRVMGCAYDVVVFTNLTQDHLDFHQTMDEYWQCKQKLFYPPYVAQKENVHAVINCDNDYGLKLKDDVQIQSIRVGGSPENDIYCQKPDISLSCISGLISTPKGTLSLHSPLTGHHNLQNILCAAGAAIALDIPIERISSGISQTGSVPGRLERLTEFTDRYVFVDYAHTPDALENVIQCIRQSKTKGLITVFGCGGDRDRGKRPLMGKVAASLSDCCIVTSDNPRSESPEAIINDICKGIPDLKSCIVEPDRKKAIELAIKKSCPEDVVLIAGKGHETYQILKDKTIDFDDRVCALSARLLYAMSYTS
jgi:UDP-N-acetylmuramyl-tripeptide synthetase